MSKKQHRICALYADDDGNIFDAPRFCALGSAGGENFLLDAEDLIPLPEGADLMYMPDRAAMGVLDGEEMPIVGQAVAAILPPGYTRLYLPAFIKEETAEPLPLYGYTAAVLYKDDIYVAATPTDDTEKWNPLRYNTKKLKNLVQHAQDMFPDNRIVAQIGKCSLQWHCVTAQNFFYGRGEAGVPVSPACNARCLGCISLQEAECCPSPQSRIDFAPTAEEIAEMCVYHLKNAPRAIVSFGQGCEGEPSLAADNIVPAIKLIRGQTDCGQININTNGGNTAGLKRIIAAGLNSMRVSIISAREESYNAYYRAGYGLGAVKETINLALKAGVYVSLNLLHFPGFTDREEEWAAWREFLKEYPVNMIQMRNLNIDPELFLAAMPPRRGEILGVRRFLTMLKEEFPAIAVGNFSHYNEAKQ